MIANYITLARIAGTVGLLFLKPLTHTFFILYSICGLTDVLDGFVARRTNTASEFGSKLDSISDLIFYTVIMIMILPDLWIQLDRWIWFWVALILILRIACYIIAFVKKHKFASPHTKLNKVTGFLVFMVPFFLKFKIMEAYAVITAVIATFAVLYEISLHIKPDDSKKLENKG